MREEGRGRRVGRAFGCHAILSLSQAIGELRAKIACQKNGAEMAFVKLGYRLGAAWRTGGLGLSTGRSEDVGDPGVGGCQ